MAGGMIIADGWSLRRQDALPRRRRGAAGGSRRALSSTPASSPASSATANSAALVAPASPIANVATGTPAGICTIEYSESCPPRWRDGDRHAEHRHGGLGGEHPRQVGGAAGAGDDRPQPALAGRFGEGEHLVGHAVRRQHLHLVGQTRTAGARRPPCSSSASRWTTPSRLRPAGSRSPAKYGIGVFAATPYACVKHSSRASAAPARSPSTTAAWARRGATQSPTRSTLTPAAFRSWYSHSTGVGGTASTTQSGVRVTWRRSGGAAG